MVVLGASVLMPVVNSTKMFVESFLLGFNAGINEEPMVISQGDAVPLDFKPDTHKYIHTTDSIEFDNGVTLPIIMDTATVLVPENSKAHWPDAIICIIGVLQVLLLIATLVLFILFIVNISKERIFVIANAKYLRTLSICVLGIALLECTGGIIGDVAVNSLHLTSKGYTLSADWKFPWDSMLIGLVGLLMATVWERGIKIREEQELTI